MFIYLIAYIFLQIYVGSWYIDMFVQNDFDRDTLHCYNNKVSCGRDSTEICWYRDLLLQRYTVTEINS